MLVCFFKWVLYDFVEFVFDGACAAHLLVWLFNAICHLFLLLWILGNVFKVVFDGACTTYFFVLFVNAVFQCVFVGGFRAMFLRLFLLVLAPLICLCCFFSYIFEYVFDLILGNVFEVVFDGACTPYFVMWFFR
jgi:hypothetical protein